MRRKRLPVLLCAAVLLLYLCPITALAAKSDSWDGTSDTSWYQGGSAYTLSTAEQLAGLAELVNGGNNFSGVTVTLDANLYLGGKSWKPIGDWSSEAAVFAGSFEGSGCSINGLNVNGSGVQGLFGYVSGAVRDLSVYGSVAAEGDTAGGIAATCSGSVSDCLFSGSVSGAGSVGALVGSCSGSVSNCTSSGSISAQSSAGGIVGRQSGGTVSECYSSSSVTSTGSRTGGIVGSAERCAVSVCTDSGAVSGGDSSGGIAGYSQSSSLSDCVVKSTVSGGQYTGGIAGSSDSSTIVNCTVTAGVTGDTNTGGIAGIVKSGSVANSSCTSAVAGSSAVGGVAGKLTASAEVENCFSAGSVSGSGSGGITGSSSGGSVTHCYWRSGGASSASGEGSATDSTSFTAGDLSWELAEEILGCKDMLDALNAAAGGSDAMNRWYASSTYPDFAEIYRLTILCQDAGGNEIAVKRQLFASGASYNVELPVVDGFTTASSSVTGTMPAEDTVLTVAYKGDTHTLTIEYVYEDGAQAFDTYSQQMDTGTKYSVPSPTIEGYTPDVPTVEGNMPAQDTVITVKYAPALYNGADGGSGSVGGSGGSGGEDGTAGSGTGTGSGTSLGFFFWFLIVAIALGLAALFILLCMLFRENGRIARFMNKLLYPENRGQDRPRRR